MDTKRVCIISDGCSKLIVPASEWMDSIAEINDFPTPEPGEEVQYTLTFKDMSVSEIDDLPEFEGF